MSNSLFPIQTGSPRERPIYQEPVKTRVGFIGALEDKNGNPKHMVCWAHSNDRKDPIPLFEGTPIKLSPRWERLFYEMFRKW